MTDRAWKDLSEWERQEYPHVQHGQLKPALENETDALPHAEGPEDFWCWCDPEALTPCTACEREPGHIHELDGEADTLPPCTACEGSGLMAWTEAVGRDVQILLVHRDV